MRYCHRCSKVFEFNDTDKEVCIVCGEPLCPECVDAYDQVCGDEPCEHEADILDTLKANRVAIRTLTNKYDTLRRAVVEFLDATDRWQYSDYGSFCIACGSKMGSKHIHCPLEELERLTNE